MEYRVEELSIPGGIFTIFREELHFSSVGNFGFGLEGGRTKNSGGNFDYFPGGLSLISGGNVGSRIGVEEL